MPVCTFNSASLLFAQSSYGFPSKNAWTVLGCMRNASPSDVEEYRVRLDARLSRFSDQVDRQLGEAGMNRKSRRRQVGCRPSFRQGYDAV